MNAACSLLLFGVLVAMSGMTSSVLVTQTQKTWLQISLQLQEHLTIWHNNCNAGEYKAYYSRLQVIVSILRSVNTYRQTCIVSEEKSFFEDTTGNWVVEYLNCVTKDLHRICNDNPVNVCQHANFASETIVLVKQLRASIQTVSVTDVDIGGLGVIQI